MRYFVVYSADGFRRQGTCQHSTFHLQARKEEGEFVMEGHIQESRQDIIFDGIDENGRPINPQIVDRMK